MSKKMAMKTRTSFSVIRSFVLSIVSIVYRKFSIDYRKDYLSINDNCMIESISMHGHMNCLPII